MKKIIFVNNNMKIGGIQKSLANLLNEIKDDFEITLLLFDASGSYMEEIPNNVNVVQCKSLFVTLGMGQNESKRNIKIYILRALLVIITKILGRRYAMKLILLSQRKINEEYDYAISFLQNGNEKSFYGGCNEFVLKKIHAKKKIGFLHCDYSQCGANTKYNNKLYHEFDNIAACSKGCKDAFISIMPELSNKVSVVSNCHNFENILELSDELPYEYDKNCINIVSVARLNTEKGIERGIEAIKYVMDRDIKIKYHIVGEGINRQNIELLIKELNIEENVYLYGNTDNPYRYMVNADLLFIPSYHEAAPLVIDEAICVGLPVLSTKTTSSKDMILDRNIGWVCANNQQGINEKLYEISKDASLISKYKKNVEKIICSNKKAVTEFFSILGEEIV